MRIFLFILTISFCSNVQGQGRPFDKFSADTIKLKEFTANKILAYKINSVTIYLKYEDYENELYTFWKLYDYENKMITRELGSKKNINAVYDPKFKVIDSIYKLITKEVKTTDTIYLAQKVFDKVGIPCVIDLGEQIEKGACAIVDDKNFRHYTIIKQKGSLDDRYGGRQYFLPGQKSFFYEVIDWWAD